MSLPKLDVVRYAGVWYELARSKDIPFEVGAQNVRATYTWDGITFRITNDATVNGKPIQWKASASRIDGNVLTLDNGATYRILMFDPNYQWAVVTSNAWIWILGREKMFTKTLWDQLICNLEFKYNVDFRNIVYTVHDRADTSDSLAYEPETECNNGIKVIIHM